MRFTFDDDSERALMAARMGYSASVSDADLAASVAAWFDSKPTGKPAARKTGAGLTANDFNDLRVVDDWSDDADAEAEPGSYMDPMHGWLGQG